MKLSNPLTALAIAALAVTLHPSSHAEAIAGPPELVPPAPKADFTFVVPVVLSRIHQDAIDKGIWVVCNVYNHTAGEREQAHTELESKWSLAKAEEIQRWHLGQGKTAVTLSPDGSLTGKISVELDVDPDFGEPGDARSWECHLAIGHGKMPTKDLERPAYLRAKAGTAFSPVHKGDF